MAAQGEEVGLGIDRRKIQQVGPEAGEDLGSGATPPLCRLSPGLPQFAAVLSIWYLIDFYYA